MPKSSILKKKLAFGSLGIDSLRTSGEYLDI